MRGGVQRHPVGHGGAARRLIETTEQTLERAEAVVQKLYRSHQGRVHAWFQFRGLNNSTVRLIAELNRLADRYGVGGCKRTPASPGTRATVAA